MYAVIAETTDIAADSSVRAVAGASDCAQLEARFVENWARLSGAFGMGEDTGRAHAAIYLAEAPLTMAQVAVRVGLPVADAADAIAELVDYGAIRAEGQHGSSPAYVSEQDPWTWFISTVRRRAALEFMPLMRAIRDVSADAARMQQAGNMSAERLDRINRFCAFVDQVSSMLGTLGNMGGGSMFGAMRSLSRFLPR